MIIKKEIKMKKIFVILALLVSFADARDKDGVVGFGLTAGGYGTGFLVMYDAFKFIYIPNTGSDSYILDYELWNYDISDDFEIYVGAGVMYSGNFAVRLPIGLDWNLIENFDIFVEYAPQLNVTNWSYGEVTAIGLRISF